MNAPPFFTVFSKYISDLCKISALDRGALRARRLLRPNRLGELSRRSGHDLEPPARGVGRGSVSGQRLAGQLYLPGAADERPAHRRRQQYGARPPVGRQRHSRPLPPDDRPLPAASGRGDPFGNHASRPVECGGLGASLDRRGDHRLAGLCRGRKSLHRIRRYGRRGRAGLLVGVPSRKPGLPASPAGAKARTQPPDRSRLPPEPRSAGSGERRDDPLLAAPARRGRHRDRLAGVRLRSASDAGRKLCPLLPRYDRPREGPRGGAAPRSGGAAGARKGPSRLVARLLSAELRFAARQKDRELLLGTDLQAGLGDAARRRSAGQLRPLAGADPLAQRLVEPKRAVELLAPLRLQPAGAGAAARRRRGGASRQPRGQCPGALPPRLGGPSRRHGLRTGRGVSGSRAARRRRSATSPGCATTSGCTTASAWTTRSCAGRSIRL